MKKDPTHIDQKLLVLYLLEEISQQGRSKVEAWLDISEENRIFFDGFRKTWEETGKIDAGMVAFDTNAAWEKMSGKIGKNEKSVKNEKSEKNVKKGKKGKEGKEVGWKVGMVRIILAAAAVLVLGVMSVVLVKFLRNQEEPRIETLASYSVPLQDTLNDGSNVILNADTKLIIPTKFAQTSRRVTLRGEAFFEVAHDSLQPFIIDAGLGQVKVLGTSFQVKAYPDSDLEVFVESGRVELSAYPAGQGDTVKIVLKAGERGMIKRGTHEISKPAEIGPDELFWANKKLIFQETKLSVVFDLLKKHYRAEIEVQDAAILNCLLSATFTDESIAEIMEVVAASFDLKMHCDQQKFVINGKGCSNED
jgi:ferric-dicitrate binding protein FerR (iron transport regulator)